MPISLSGAALTKVNLNSPSYLKLKKSLPNLQSKDSTLWGADAQAEAVVRLNWIDLPVTSHDLLPQLDALSAWARARQLTNIILCGMGGSSLAPEVIAKSYNKKLSVLDSTDPAQIAAAIPSDLTNTVVVVGSKSGNTIETASQRSLFIELFTQAGLDPIDHIVHVTDPGSPLDMAARNSGYRTINADPNVGGRYSALSAFGLVPAALMGIDVSLLLDDAENATQSFTEADSPALLIAEILFTQTDQNIAFFDSGSVVPGLSDWIEQLIAESTGKNQTGRLPVVIENSDAPIAGSALSVGFYANAKADLIVEATLGEQFILWEWVTALLGLALGVDPFNQPNVTEAKERTSALLMKWIDDPTKQDQKVIEATCTFENEELQVFSTSNSASLLEQLQDFGKTKSHYISVMAYLARGIDDEIKRIRPLLARKTNRAVTFGWGPRFLHSTGQFHKGGQPNGAFLQITGESSMDLEIPGRGFSFHTLIMAQALGDAAALQSRDFPVLRIHLKNRSAGITQLLSALEDL
jgi:glucose-6-phosphate isomerase